MEAEEEEEPSHNRSDVTPVRFLMVSGTALKRRAPFCEKQLCMQAMRGVQHAIIDNLQFMLRMGHTGTASDHWWEQDKAVANLWRFATQTCCHGTIIVHPKKVCVCVHMCVYLVVLYRVRAGLLVSCLHVSIYQISP
ncbi:Twinkle protein, mitochondrial [Portunus trituberculatus]|uniref:Twinkle protein, mitochondrial n=1 Tax=Portunus trituberculatus TaxID=210409 RepID=A0A5B7FSX3_PORTR|nr:Twinkle protein, mitochondrial [Portunus trituberculatus]